MRARRSRLVCSLALFGMVGCSDEGDVAGRIEGADTVWATISPEPLLHLGADQSNPAEQFHRIVGVTRLSDGVVVVADGSQRIRFFAPTGQLLQEVGGQGAGPGEFEALAMLQRDARGDLVTWDPALGRITTLSDAGAVMHSARVVPDPGFPPLLVPDGVFWDGSLLAMAGPPIDREFEDGRWAAITLLQLGKDGGVRGSLGEFRLQPCRPGEQNCGRYYRSFRAAWAAGEDHVYYSRPDRAEITVYDLEGHQLGQLEGPGLGKEAEGSVPAYSELLVDTAGNVWAKAGDASGWWFVFDSRQYVGRVQLPPDLDVKQIGPGFVLGVQKDELDVEHVKAYQLRVAGA